MRPIELSQEGKLLAADLLPTVAPGFRHNRSMPEKKSERKGFVLTFFSSLFATPARLPSLGCPLPAATAPGALATAGLVLCRSATTQTALSTAASVPARTLGRHRPRCGSTFPAGCGTKTGIQRKDPPGVSPGTTGRASRSLSFHRPLRSPPGC